MPNPTNPFAGDPEYLSKWDNAFSYLFGPQFQKDNPFGRWLQNQSSIWQNKYTGDVAREGESYNMTPLEYMQRFNPQEQWSALSPSQRGEASSPILKWLQTFGQR